MVCGDCKYCRMAYDKHDDEIFYCSNELGRGCKDVEDEACIHFRDENDNCLEDLEEEEE